MASARSGIRIRDARPHDAAEIYTLLRQMGYSSELDGLRDRVTRLLDAPSNQILVATIGHDIVGLTSLMIGQSVEHPAPTCRLSAIVVDEAHGRRGVGAALMAASEEAARAAGCFRIELTTAHDNVGAHALYRSAGWEETGLRFKRVF